MMTVVGLGLWDCVGSQYCTSASVSTTCSPFEEWLGCCIGDTVYESVGRVDKADDVNLVPWEDAN